MQGACGHRDPSGLRLGWGSGESVGAGRPVIGSFSPLLTPTSPAASGSKAGLWLMGDGFMAGGDATGDLSLGHGQHHLLRHLPALGGAC